jgi:hypothetical protein
MQAPLDPGFEATQVLSFALGSAFCNGFAGRQRRLRIGQQRLLGAEHAQQSLEHVAHHESGVDRRGLWSTSATGSLLKTSSLATAAS